MDLKEMIEELGKLVNVLGGNAVILRNHFSPVGEAAEGASASEIKKALINFEIYLRNVKEKVVNAYVLWEKIMDELNVESGRPLDS